MNKIHRQLLNILIRYVLLLLVAFPDLFIFYLIFTPITIYLAFFLLNLFFEASLSGNIIFLDDVSIKIIPACVAGAAYYLLLILNFSTPNIEFRKRVKMIFVAFASLLILNILRILILSFITLSKPSLFNTTHEVFWYGISTLSVVGIWFAEVKLFKIKQIPFYSDIKFVFSKIKC